ACRRVPGGAGFVERAMDERRRTLRLERAHCGRGRRARIGRDLAPVQVERVTIDFAVRMGVAPVEVERTVLEAAPEGSRRRRPDGRLPGAVLAEAGLAGRARRGRLEEAEHF